LPGNCTCRDAWVKTGISAACTSRSWDASLAGSIGSVSIVIVEIKNNFSTRRLFRAACFKKAPLRRMQIAWPVLQSLWFGLHHQDVRWLILMTFRKSAGRLRCDPQGGANWSLHVIITRS
jgi:hypothetical protein